MREIPSPWKGWGWKPQLYFDDFLDGIPTLIFVYYGILTFEVIIFCIFYLDI